LKQEKTGRIAEVIFHNDTNMYSILVFETEDEQFTAVGYMPRPQKGRSFVLLGDWVNHPRFGEQFSFSSFEEVQPTTEDGIESFLSSGVIKGVGPSTARAIVRRFGKETLEILSSCPERLTEIGGIGKKKASAIAEAYAAHREYADTVMALSAFDIGPSVCLKLYKVYGARSVDVVRENPYSLIADVWGIGFRKADAIAKKLGFDGDSPFRIKSGIEYYLNERANSGDTYAEKTALLEDVAGFLDVTREQALAALEDQVMDGRVFLENLGGQEIVMLYRFYAAEKRVAAKLYELCHAELKHIPWNMEKLIAKTEKESGITLSDKQKNAVISSIKNGVSVVTGGPGTGKTTIINTILKILQAAGVSTALAAPTGRAAKRMSQTTGAEASTIHRLLEYSYQDGEEIMRFGRNSENPLDFDCIIVDEMSMVDILLMDGLMAAVKPGTRLILVGDADQLPPVGAGNVLRDILSSETVHSVRLTEIFRQAAESMIVVNAHLINRGEYPSWNQKGKDFFFMERRREAEIAATLKELCESRLPAFYSELDALTDIQILTPTKKGLIGSAELNRMLQDALNPASPGKNEREFGGRILREGDKVIQNRNDYELMWHSIKDLSEGMGVFNGDIGIIARVDNDEGSVTVIFDEERLVSYDLSNLDELEPAFALTVHKSQGSEFPVVVMPVARFAPMLSTRNLLYTAVTRAKQGVVLVGIPEACRAMVDNDSVAHRNSGLAERLTELWELGF